MELQSLEELLGFLNRHGGGLGVFAPEEDEDAPVIEIFDDDADDEEQHCRAQ